MQEKYEEDKDANCNADTDRVESHNLQFHRLALEAHAFNELVQIKNNISKTPSNLASFNTQNNPKRFIWPIETTVESNNEKNLNDANFNGKGIAKLPVNFIVKFSRAKSIDLRQNCFVNFPPEIIKFTGLRILRLDNNSISIIPPEISKLHSLQILTLSKNALQIIEPGISKLSLLTALVLNDNNIVEWPVWVCSLPKLKLLHLHNNPLIPNIPIAFYKMAYLNELGFDWVLYIDPPVTRILKGTAGQKTITEIKSLCRTLDQQKNQKLKCCSFLEFMQHFNSISATYLAPVLYAKNRTPFHLAAMHGHFNIVVEYLNVNIDHNQKDSEGSTAFSLALRNNRQKVVKLLLTSPKINITLKGEKHGSPLHLAIIREQFEVARIILSKPELDPNAKDLNGNTALHYLFVKFESNPIPIHKITTLLINCENCDLNPKNSSGQTPLLCAARSKQDSAIKFAVGYNVMTNKARKFDFTVKNGKDEISLLQYISQYCEVETLDLVLKKCDMEEEIMRRDKVGRSAKDCVRNSTAAKLLRKYEREIIRRTVFSEEPGTNTERNSVIETIRNFGDFHNMNESNMSHNLFCLSGLKQFGVIQENKNSDFGDISEIDFPIDLMAYTTTPPLMFEDLRKMNQINIADTEEKYEDIPKVEIIDNFEPKFDNADTEKLSDDEQMFNINKNSTLQPDSIKSIKEKFLSPSFKHDFGLTIEIPPDTGNTLKHKNSLFTPTGVKQKPNKINGLLTSTFSQGKLRVQLMNKALEEQAILANNPLGFIYNMIIQEDCTKFMQYRLVFNLFKKYSQFSEELLVILINNLSNVTDISLKSDIIYLLSLMRSRKAIKILTKMGYCRLGKILNNELLNAKANIISRERNYFPVKYEKNEYMTPSKNTHVFTKLERNELFRTQIVKGVKKFGNMGPEGSNEELMNNEDAYKIKSVPVNRPGCYFDNMV